MVDRERQMNGMEKQVVMLLWESGPLSMDSLVAQVNSNNSWGDVFKAVMNLMLKGVVGSGDNASIKINESDMRVGYSPVERRWWLYRRTFDYPRPEYYEVVALSAKEVVRLVGAGTLVRSGDEAEYMKLCNHVGGGKSNG